MNRQVDRSADSLSQAAVRGPGGFPFGMCGLGSRWLLATPCMG